LNNLKLMNRPKKVKAFYLRKDAKQVYEKVMHVYFKWHFVAWNIFNHFRWHDIHD
jgi:hypothetical protein